MLILSVTMQRAGEIQLIWVFQQGASHSRRGTQEHPLPNFYAFGRYMDYGLNAPAWALSSELPFFLPSGLETCCGFIPGERGWEYLILVAAMWFGIGAWLDKRRTGLPRRKGDGPKWLSFALRAICGLGGAFLWYAAVESFRSQGSGWFEFKVALWGTGLILASLYPPYPTRDRLWRVLLGILVALFGLMDCYGGVRIYQYRSGFGVWSSILMFIWGVAFLVISAYMVLGSQSKSSQPASATA